MSIAHGKDFFLTDYANNLIKVKARQLCRRHDFRAEAHDDVQQELWLALCEKIDKFNPAKASLDTFIDRVVNKALASILRARKRLKRDGKARMQSFSEEVLTELRTPSCLADLVTADDLGRRIGRTFRDAILDQECAQAIEWAISGMPKHLQDVASGLMRGSIHSVARELGISRRAVHHAILEIREFLDRAELRNS